MQAEVCTALTHLAHNDVNALNICDNNGVFVIASLLCDVPPAPADPVLAPDAAAAPRKLLLCALRALRFLFALPQNRRPFKRLFPPEMFEAFLRAKHYNYDLAAYQPALDALTVLAAPGAAPGGAGAGQGSNGAMAALAKAIAAVDVNAVAVRHVRDYALLERLGEGAFGCVYRARRDNTGELVAVKEMAMGADDAALTASIEHEVRVTCVRGAWCSAAGDTVCVGYGAALLLV